MNFVGIDECGYGSCAGPLVVCGVRAPDDWSMDGLRDSKKLTRERREALNRDLDKLLEDGTISYFIAMSSSDEIDSVGLGAAHKMCIADVAKALRQKDDAIILDGNLNPKHFAKYGIDDSFNFRSEIKADDRFPSVMAASIIGKVYRDNMMRHISHTLYPYYGWDTNVGYITPDHKEAIRKYGFSSFHRKSYNIKLT